MRAASNATSCRRRSLWRSRLVGMMQLLKSAADLDCDSANNSASEYLVRIGLVFSLIAILAFQRRQTVGREPFVDCPGRAGSYPKTALGVDGGLDDTHRHRIGLLGHTLQRDFHVVDPDWQCGPPALLVIAQRVVVVQTHPDCRH